MIPFYRPSVSSEESMAIAKVIESGNLTHGETVRDFEAEIERKVGCGKCIALDSCTAALEMSLRALGIGEGDEVITTPFTYSATAEVIRNVGSKIVFADIEKDSFFIDTQEILKKINNRTKAVIPVDYGGVMFDYEQLKRQISNTKFVAKNEFQEKIGRIAIIADAAHSFGAMLNGVKSGCAADFNCFSFHAVKPITTGGEGGAVCFDSMDEELADRISLIADHGQTKRDKKNGWEYDIKLFGFNSIMTNIDAAFGLCQLKNFDKTQKKRERVARMYNDMFEEDGVTALNHFDKGMLSAYHLYPLKIRKYSDDERNAEFRNKLYAFMLENGICCNVHYKPLPMMTAYKNDGFDIKDYPNAYSRFVETLTIPFHSELEFEQIAYIAAIIKRSLKCVK